MKKKEQSKDYKICPINSQNIFGSGASFKSRCMVELEELKKFVEHCKGIGLKIVLTQGAYDLIHIGHARYLENAKKQGDLLIVGVDADDKVRAKKGPERPVVPQEERLEMLSHLRSVDIVTLKKKDAPKWNLTKTLQPDVLVATEETYTPEELKKVSEHCGKVVVLKQQATTSTSAKVRRMQLATAKKLGNTLTPKLIKAIEETFEEIKDKSKAKAK
jgi:D-beta-D-heptose 7-phosphate kinase/D-beta-D-heptose 1-phosphate adenosyltransferase